MKVIETAEFKGFLKVFPSELQVENIPEAVFVMTSYALNCGGISRKDYYGRHRIILELLKLTHEDLLSEERVQEVIGHKYEQRTYIEGLFNDDKTTDFWGSTGFSRDNPLRKLWSEIQSLGISYVWE